MRDYTQPGWADKGATLSDKTARKEFGLTQQEILDAVNAGELQFRQSFIHGNPYLRLRRHEVQAFVAKKHGKDHLKTKLLKKELTEVNRELKSLKAQTASLELRKTELLEMLKG